MSRTRFNIGLLVANIMDSFSNRVSKGAIAAAEKLDANLVVFPMKYLDIEYDNASYDMKFEYQYNILMDYAAKAKLDYLIVCTGTIAYISDDNRKKEVLDYLSDTPILNVASRIEGYDHLIFDNAAGITQAVNYLVKEQNRKHICMMIGKKCEYIKQLNLTAKKPYPIDMSMGFCECRCESSYDFKEAVDKADVRLYDDKAERKRRNKKQM